jgi:hypothetical protein
MMTISAGPSLEPSSNRRAKLRRGLFNFQAAPLIVSGYPGQEMIAKLAIVLKVEPAELLRFPAVRAGASAGVDLCSMPVQSGSCDNS